MSEYPSRLFLITPVLDEAASFLPRLEEALSVGDVACLLLRFDPAVGSNMETDKARMAAVKPLVEAAQARGVAVLIEADTALASAVAADGVHVTDPGPELARTIRTMKPAGIVGVGSLESRDDAMQAGEGGVDYLMFGDDRRPFADRLDQVAWWAEIFEIPCVGLAEALSEVEPIAAAGADFVALSDAVWSDPRGIRAALGDAFDSLARAAASRAEAVQ